MLQQPTKNSRRSESRFARTCARLGECVVQRHADPQLDVTCTTRLFVIHLWHVQLCL